MKRIHYRMRHAPAVWDVACGALWEGTKRQVLLGILILAVVLVTELLAIVLWGFFRIHTTAAMREIPAVAFTLWLVIDLIPPLRHLPAVVLAIILAALGVPFEFALVLFAVFAVGMIISHAISEVRNLLAELRVWEEWAASYEDVKRLP
ncbi:MAG: hypothetical protein WA373_02000 [Burkholderiales bacterium]